MQGRGRWAEVRRMIYVALGAAIIWAAYGDTIRAALIGALR